MKLVIDASNIRQGGGVTHLQEVLKTADFKKHGFSKVTVWAPQSTLDRIGELPLLERKVHPLIEKSGWAAMWFRMRVLDQLIAPDTDLFWCPGGTCLSSFRPYVTMVQNFLPFDKVERDRYKYSKNWFRFLYLRYVQSMSFKRAKGLIHISDKTHEVINAQMDLSKVEQKTIHHGLNPRFYLDIREHREFEAFTLERPARLLYVSNISLYKHQDKLVQAVAKLRAKGIPIHLDLVGRALPSAKVIYDRVVQDCDPRGEWIKWHGEVPYAEVLNYYRDADLYPCMSSCETFGMILLEAMAAGLPILCSNKSALPEIQGGTCPEVNPEDVDAVAAGLERMLRNKDLRATCGRDAYERALTFTWEKCADSTFSFLAACVHSSLKLAES